MTATWPTAGHVVVRPAVDSTNSEANRLLAAGADHGLVVRADCQSAGRGRRGRTWVSPPGNLYCSLLARPPIPAPAPLATLTFVAALAVHQLVRAALPAARAVVLKWPNDVLVDGAKVSGILLEGQHGGAGPAVIIGVGINLASHPADAPYAVTDLAAGGGRLTVDGALTALLGAFGPWYDRWASAGFAPVRAAWLAAAGPLGTAIAVNQGAARRHGRFAGLDEQGGLLLETAPGSYMTIASGDVTVTE